MLANRLKSANCGKAELSATKEKEPTEKELPAAEESEPAQLPPLAFRQVSHSAAGIFFRPDFLNRFHFHFLILGFFWSGVILGSVCAIDL